MPVKPSAERVGRYREVIAENSEAPCDCGHGMPYPPDEDKGPEDLIRFLDEMLIHMMRYHWGESEAAIQAHYAGPM